MTGLSCCFEQEVHLLTSSVIWMVQLKMIFLNLTHFELPKSQVRLKFLACGQVGCQSQQQMSLFLNWIEQKKSAFTKGRKWWCSSKSSLFTFWPVHELVGNGPFVVHGIAPCDLLLHWPRNLLDFLISSVQHVWSRAYAQRLNQNHADWISQMRKFQ